MIKRNEIVPEWFLINPNDPDSDAVFVTRDEILDRLPDSDFRDDYSEEEINEAINNIVNNKQKENYHD